MRIIKRGNRQRRSIEEKFRLKHVVFSFSKKVAWTGSRTKIFTVPTSENAFNDKTVEKYWKRTKDCDNLTLIEWLRLFDTNKTNPKAYKQGSTIVGTKQCHSSTRNISSSLFYSLTLDSYQLAVSHHIDKVVHSRQQFYTNDSSLNSHQSGPHREIRGPEGNF